MRLYPAIDLKDGQCVRLAQGDMAHAKIYNTNPVQQAKIFMAQGFTYLHVIDLNGAVEGHAVNSKAVQAIMRTSTIPIQLGGGLRDMASIDHWLSQGVARVILGTAALQNPSLIRQASKAYPGRICVALDARHGRLAMQGWTSTSQMTPADALACLADCALAAAIYTDIARDGMLKGVNIDAVVALAQNSAVPIIASGGVRDIIDIEALLAAPVPIEGVICGRALYEGQLDVPRALAMVGAQAPC